jgi:hypothetical protein
MLAAIPRLVVPPIRLGEHNAAQQAQQDSETREAIRAHKRKVEEAAAAVALRLCTNPNVRADWRRLACCLEWAARYPTLREGIQVSLFFLVERLSTGEIQAAVDETIAAATTEQ